MFNSSYDDAKIFAIICHKHNLAHINGQSQSASLPSEYLKWRSIITNTKFCYKSHSGLGQKFTKTPILVHALNGPILKGPVNRASRWSK